MYPLGSGFLTWAVLIFNFHKSTRLSENCIKKFVLYTDTINHFALSELSKKERHYCQTKMELVQRVIFIDRLFDVIATNLEIAFSLLCKK